MGFNLVLTWLVYYSSVSLDSSRLPIEARIDQLMSRIDSLDGVDSSKLGTGSSSKEIDNFKMMMAMMQMDMDGSPKSEARSEMMPMNFNSFPPLASGFGQSESMLFPLKGRISSDYGNRTHPLTGHQHFHSGVDIAADKGAPVRMPYSGRVSFVGHVDGFGDNTVIVAHENQRQPDGKILYSVFGHNDNVFVQPGEQIKQGEIFATVGNEGNSTGPHLHWETRVAPEGIQALDVFKQQVSMTVNPMNLA